MKASLGGQIVIALGGFVSAIIICTFFGKAIYTVVRYIQWMNMAIIYVARKTGTPLPEKLIEQYHHLPYNGNNIDHVLEDDPEPDGKYPLPPRAKSAHIGEN